MTDTTKKEGYESIPDVESGDAGEFTEQETRADGSVLWKWEVSGQLTSVPNVYDVTVTVTSTNANAYSYTLSQLIFDPLFQGTAAPAVDPTATSTAGGMPP